MNLIVRNRHRSTKSEKDIAQGDWGSISNCFLEAPRFQDEEIMHEYLSVVLTLGRKNTGLVKDRKFQTSISENYTNTEIYKS
jgi:hypothetical protein